MGNLSFSLHTAPILVAMRGYTLAYKIQLIIIKIKIPYLLLTNCWIVFICTTLENIANRKNINWYKIILTTYHKVGLIKCNPKISFIKSTFVVSYSPVMLCKIIYIIFATTNGIYILLHLLIKKWLIHLFETEAIKLYPV